MRIFWVDFPPFLCYDRENRICTQKVWELPGPFVLESEMFDYMELKWRRKRENILRRDGYRCQECKRYGRRRAATEVHHIKPVESWPELAYNNENLISLCHGCHNKMHPEKALAMRGRY